MLFEYSIIVVNTIVTMNMTFQVEKACPLSLGVILVGCTLIPTLKCIMHNLIHIKHELEANGKRGNGIGLEREQTSLVE